MSTFTFGFVISQLALLERLDFPDPHMKKLCIKVYARPELHKDLEKTVKVIDLESRAAYEILFLFSTFTRESRSLCCRYKIILALIFHWKSWTLWLYRTFQR